MRQKKKKEKELRLAELSAVRKKNVGDYFLNTSRWHREWLKELAERYKERGEFPIMSLTLLPSYYDSQQDKEVAIFAALLFNDGENTLERVSAFRQMFGKSPWEWFEQRKFVSLSFGRNRHNVLETFKPGCGHFHHAHQLFFACLDLDTVAIQRV